MIKIKDNIININNVEGASIKQHPPASTQREAGGCFIHCQLSAGLHVAVFQPLNDRMYELYVVVGKPVGADGESHVQTEQIIGGYIKNLRQLHQRLCGGNRNAHFPGVHA